VRVEKGPGRKPSVSSRKKEKDWDAEMNALEEEMEVLLDIQAAVWEELK